MDRPRPSYRLLTLIFALGVLQAVGLAGFELYRLHLLHRRVAALEAENARLWRRVRGLEAALEKGDDPALLEALAREMGWVRKDEVLYARTPH